MTMPKGREEEIADARPELPELPETGLDPDDPEALRRLGHRMVDDLIDHHSRLRERPAWQPPGPADVEALGARPPSEPAGADAAYEEFLERVRPYAFGNLHPLGLGWVNGAGTTLGALAEMLAAGMNPNVWGGHHAATHMEEGVLGFFREAFGFPSHASGLLVSGGSVANLVALAAAREAGFAGEAGADGLRGEGGQLVLYASELVHNSVDKAASLLGIGWRHLRKLPTDEDLRLDVGALESAVAADRSAGMRPFCVVATAGTVDTGSIDPLEEIAELCRNEGLWMHVDGAFGALAALSPRLRPQVRGLDLADSLAFDLHKWLQVPIEAGCLLVRHPEWHRRPFSPPAPYLAWSERGVASGPHNYSTLGPQLTRGFRALKVWMSLRAHGSEVYGRLVEQNVRQARHLEARVRAEPRLELVAPVPLNVVCFRFRPDGASEGDLEAMNRELLLRLQESGRAAPSSTMVRGKFALRTAFTNHRTRIEDVDRLVEAVLEIGDGQVSSD